MNRPQKVRFLGPTFWGHIKRSLGPLFTACMSDTIYNEIIESVFNKNCSKNTILFCLKA